jgi:hypothetical protein
MFDCIHVFNPLGDTAPPGRRPHILVKLNGELGWGVVPTLRPTKPGAWSFLSNLCQLTAKIHEMALLVSPHHVGYANGCQ